MAEQFEEMQYKGYKNIADEFGSPRLIAEKILGKTAITSSLTIPIQTHYPNTGKTEVTLTTIPFYMRDNFSIGSLTNTWQDLVDMSNLNDFTQFLNAMSIVNGNAQVTMQSEATSSKVWKGTSFDGFTINCLFVATRRSFDPTKIIQAIAATALPGKAIQGDPSVSGALDAGKRLFQKAADVFGSFSKYVVGGADTVIKTFNDKQNEVFNADKAKQQVDDFTQFSKAMIGDVGMTAPLQYGIVYDDKTDDSGKRSINGVRPRKYTTVMLQVGDYFRAPYLLVRGVSNITFSKEVIKPVDNFSTRLGTDIYNNTPIGDGYGFPLYAECSISLIPSSMMHLDKFQSYFIKPTDAYTQNQQEGMLKSYYNGDYENIP